MKALIERHPDLVYPLGGFETVVKDYWPYDENSDQVQEYLHSVKTRTASNWVGKLIMRSNKGSRELGGIIAEASTTSNDVVVFDEAKITVTTEL